MRHTHTHDTRTHASGLTRAHSRNTLYIFTTQLIDTCTYTQFDQKSTHNQGQNTDAQKIFM